MSSSYTFSLLEADPFPVNPLGFLRPTKKRRRTERSLPHVDIGPFAPWREPYVMRPSAASDLLSIPELPPVKLVRVRTMSNLDYQ